MDNNGFKHLILTNFLWGFFNQFYIFFFCFSQINGILFYVIQHADKFDNIAQDETQVHWPEIVSKVDKTKTREKMRNIKT